ncbi:deoxyguanosinetriphosphate triphosphohydrolase family protein [Fodinibius sp. SL11]|uniref:deoxyguanosinetriphosphate triphosphohydrolase family protein n=1 Tax=Fodinibius sp. SL11 TaxID=3425690 RepID=UPI003F885218
MSSKNQEIDLSTEDREYIKKKYREINGIHERAHEVQIDERERNDYQRDYARVLYSSSFRRLQGKMQILGIHHDKFYRNRLTHSLEVAQIARTMAGNLRRAIKDDDLSFYGKDMYVIDTCALSHDLGHPPFGHYGETILNDIDKEINFEGNAQSVRILTKLEKKAPNVRGLNLTFRSLLGTSKYIYSENEEHDGKYLYKDDHKKLTKYAGKNDICLRTLDVQIVDIADEIAYAAHDLEDSLSLGLFTIDEFIHELKVWLKREYPDSNADDKFQELVEKCRDFAYKGESFNSSEEYSFLFKKELTSKIVDTLIKDIGLVEVEEEMKNKTNTEQSKELGFKKWGVLSKALKKVTFECINRSDIIHLYEAKGKAVIEGLYKAFIDKAFNKENQLLPPEYRPSDKLKDSRKRLIIDYIAGMQDSYAESVFLKYYGENSLDQLYSEEEYRLKSSKYHL